MTTIKIYVIIYTQRKENLLNQKGMKMEKMIWFDMDGTIANLYAVENWLEYLMKEDVFYFPYTKGTSSTLINETLIRLRG